jgi:hypothetical protein
MKTKLILGSAVTVFIIFAVTFTMCTKEKSKRFLPDGMQTEQTLKPDKNNFIKVKSPEYFLSDKQILSLIKSFKENSKMTESSRTSTLSSSDSLSLDSAQYLLEATINYDFDHTSTQGMDTKYDVTTYNYTYNSESNYITTADVGSIYQNLYSYFEVMINEGFLIAAIDVQGYSEPTGSGYFEVSASVLSNAAVFNCPTAHFSQSFSYYILTSANIIQSHFATPPSYYPNPNAIAADYYMPSKLNCKDLYDNTCDEGYFYPNVTKHWYKPTGANIYMPFIPKQPQANYASGTNWSSINYFGGTQLSNFVNNSQTLMANSVVAPHSLVDNSAGISTIFDGPEGSSPYNLGYHWQLTWQTGERVCRTPIEH